MDNQPNQINNQLDQEDPAEASPFAALLLSSPSLSSSSLFSCLCLLQMVCCVVVLFVIIKAFKPSTSSTPSTITAQYDY